MIDTYLFWLHIVFYRWDREDKRVTWINKVLELLPLIVHT